MVERGDRVRVEVLGPIRILHIQNGDLTPSGVLQRRLLALLVLRRGRVVSADAAVEALWPTGAPRDPAGALQNHVSRLRRSLPAGLIESVGDGYRLDPALVDTDADALSAALASGSCAHPTAAAELDALLGRWQGPAYPELEDVDDGRAEAARLDELRIRAQEARAEARLAAGDPASVLAELTELADAHPLRERPRALLMAALAAEGRHAEALRVYDDFRRVLGEEIGTVPSPALAAQHADLLGGAGRSSAPPAWVPAGRLPVPTTSLVGRDDLVAEVADLAAERRLVTLVGPGGVGKTRVLLEAGNRLQAARPDRPVVLCELAAADTASAIDAVAATLGIDVRPGAPLVDRIVAVVGDTDMVVLLDNCEHVLEPIADLVDRLVASCPHLRIVATSRERLRAQGEYLSPVRPLPSGDPDAPAVQLFVERARAVTPDLDTDEAGMARIADIARRLDGLPLAIELAAARLHTHDLGEVADGLDHRFSLLTSGYRTSARHASLGAAVAWSFGLLDDALQETFSALSVFSASFDAQDAAAVCGTDVPTITGRLAQLVERSLVGRVPGRRYALLETLRAYAGEVLSSAGRSDLVARRHARHQVEWVEQADRRLLDSGSRALADIDAAGPELRSALGWLLEHGEIELAARLAVALLDYGLWRLRPDVLAWAERVTNADPEDRCPQASRLWVAAAYAAWMAGDVGEAGARSARALCVAEGAGSAVPAEVFTILGNSDLFEGRLDAAGCWYRKAVDAAASDPAQRLLAAATELLPLGYGGDQAAGARAEAVLAEVAGTETPYSAYAWYCAGEAVLSGDPEQARSRYAEALRLAELTNASFVTGLAGASKASIDARLGDPAQAAMEYRRLIDHWRRAGMWSTQWTMLRSIAALLGRLGRHRDAAVLEGAVRANGAGHRIFGGDEVALGELGARLREALGDDAYEAARRNGEELDGDGAVELALRAL